MRSALRLGLLMLGVAGIVWVGVTLALRPLERLGEAIAALDGDIAEAQAALDSLLA